MKKNKDEIEHKRMKKTMDVSGLFLSAEMLIVVVIAIIYFFLK